MESGLKMGQRETWAGIGEAGEAENPSRVRVGMGRSVHGIRNPARVELMQRTGSQLRFLRHWGRWAIRLGSSYEHWSPIYPT